MMNYPNMKVLYSTQELNHLNMKMSLFDNKLCRSIIYTREKELS